jgi:hypothetical protein
MASELARGSEGWAQSTWRRRTTLSIPICAAALALGVLGGCSGGSTARTPHEHVIVRVGASTITEAALDSWTLVMAPREEMPVPPSFTACIAYLAKLVQTSPSHAELKNACKRQYGELRQLALRALIADHWLLGEAADLGVPVSGQAISRRLEEKYPPPEGEQQYKSLLTAGDYTPADVRFEVQTELATMKLRQRLLAYSLDVGPKQIASYYQHNIRRFHVPERRKVDLVGNINELGRANSIARTVRQGASFASLSFHEQLERSNFAELPMEKAIFYRAVFSSAPNVLVGPLRINGYYFLFMVTRIERARVQPLTEVSGAIGKELSVKRRVQFVDRWRKKWKSETSCAPAYVIQKCLQYHGPTVPEDPLDVN